MGPTFRRLSSLGIALALGATLTACSSSQPSAPTTPYTSTYPSTPVPPAEVIAKVGATPITGAIYDHWLAIGGASVKPTGASTATTQPIVFQPPHFTACVKRLKESTPGSSVAKLKAACKTDYTTIKNNTLELLITGYWIREAAAKAKISVTPAELESRFETAEKEQFPTPLAFRKFQEESLQSNQDIKFGIESRLLTSLLFANFKKEYGKGRSEKATTAAYEAYIGKWKEKTNCHHGYVIKFCQQFH